MDPSPSSVTASPHGRQVPHRTGPRLLLISLLAVACGPGPDPVPAGPAGYLRFMDGVGVPGARVRVTGCPEQTSGSDGRFSTDCAASTYDVQFKLGIWGIAYQGLTRRDPVVTAPFRHITNQAATVSGAATGLTAGRAAARPGESGSPPAPAPPRSPSPRRPASSRRRRARPSASPPTSA